MLDLQQEEKDEEEEVSGKQQGGETATPTAVGENEERLMTSLCSQKCLDWSAQK